MTNFKRKTVSKRFLNVIKSNVLLAVAFHAFNKNPIFEYSKKELDDFKKKILKDTKSYTNMNR